MGSFKIGIIGAGETGTPLLKQLLDAPFVEVVGVADLNTETAGMQLAKSHGVLVTHNGLDIAELGPRVDIIIDMTGSPKVREDLRRFMQFSGNKHTVIVHERVALLMLSLCMGQMVAPIHGEQAY
ncbi:MAG: oxidoreductase [Paludibacterium sp.]|uniref:oxidoreductase n=1 Tax=Paludibacterium sp. TaxID=1917523 RepID=UPI0025CEFD20|nr:oxidoreductase [Paludibacterium sp.]MBV8047579.1 oxidoreductase [Paludibacterium sp.]MBV8646322.1 oxidoreductase [Paludibacterium sp.]